MQPLLATSELDPELASIQKSGEETVISNRPRSQNGGKNINTLQVLPKQCANMREKMAQIIGDFGQN